MKRLPAALIAALALVASGCVPSVNPLYTDRDLVFDPALVGVWAEQDDDPDTWAFEKSGDRSYRLIYTEKGKSGEFNAHLLRLGGMLFLDLFPDDAGRKEMNRNDFYQFHFLPMHTFARLTLRGGSLEIAFLDPDWLSRKLESRPKALRHERRSTGGDEGIVLTASTKDLQKFVLRHAEEAFGDQPTVLRRVRGIEGPNAGAR